MESQLISIYVRCVLFKTLNNFFLRSMVFWGGMEVENGRKRSQGLFYFYFSSLGLGTV